MRDAEGLWNEWCSVEGDAIIALGIKALEEDRTDLMVEAAERYKRLKEIRMSWKDLQSSLPQPGCPKCGYPELENSENMGDRYCPAPGCGYRTDTP